MSGYTVGVVLTTATETLDKTAPQREDFSMETQTSITREELQNLVHQIVASTLAGVIFARL